MKLFELIGGSVGQGGANQTADVRVVQRLLNDWLAKTGQAQLKVDGIAGPKTRGAISAFQKRNGLGSDGRADPKGPTLQALFQAHLAGIQAMMDLSRVSGYVSESAVKQVALSDPGLAPVIEAYVKALRKGA